MGFPNSKSLAAALSLQAGLPCPSFDPASVSTFSTKRSADQFLLEGTLRMEYHTACCQPKNSTAVLYVWHCKLCVCMCVCMWCDNVLVCTWEPLGAIFSYALRISVIYFPFNTTGYILAHWFYHLAWCFHQFHHILSLLSSRTLTPNNLLGHLPHSKGGAAAYSLPPLPKFYALEAQMICTYQDWFYLIQIFSNSASNY